MIDTTKLKIVLTERGGPVRDAMTHIMASRLGVEPVAVTANGSEVFRFVGELAPDMLFLSHTLLGPELWETIRTICERYSFVKVLVFSSHSDSRFAFRALAEGASGYMLIDKADEELEKAVKTITSHRIYLSPDVAGRERARASEIPRGAGHDA